MSKLDFKITPKMINAYHLHKQTNGSKISNLHRIWSKEIGMDVDKTQIRWINDCLTGKRSLKIYNRHGNQYITSQVMMKPDQTYSKAMNHTLDEISEAETKTMTKALRSWL